MKIAIPTALLSWENVNNLSQTGHLNPICVDATLLEALVAFVNHLELCSNTFGLPVDGLACSHSAVADLSCCLVSWGPIDQRP